MYTLLVWEEIPEEIKFYLIPNDEMKPKWKEFLEQAHNRIINQDDYNDGLKFLNTALAKDKETAEEGFEEYVGVFADYEYKYKDNPIKDKKITEVYWCGFNL